MARDPIPSHCFALVVARLGRRVLLVHERKHGQLWYLPAGRVEPGETFAQAARRETLEEAGVPIEVDGILAVQHTPQLGSQRTRVVFTARPADDTPPKSVPDEESLEARWVTLEEAAALPLRGGEVLRWARQGLDGPVHPLSVLGREGDDD